LRSLDGDEGGRVAEKPTQVGRSTRAMLTYDMDQAMDEESKKKRGLPSSLCSRVSPNTLRSLTSRRWQNQVHDTVVRRQRLAFFLLTGQTHKGQMSAPISSRHCVSLHMCSHLESRRYQGTRKLDVTLPYTQLTRHEHETRCVDSV
jgi:hypothetical protein